MAKGKLSLIDYLKRPNPDVNSDQSWLGPNTSTPATPLRLHASDIVEWKDFNLETLLNIYGEILKLPADDLPDFSCSLPFHLIQIKDEDSLEALLIRWNNAVVSCALSVAQRPGKVGSPNERGIDTEEIHMARGGHACLPSETKNKKGVRPDWAGISRGKTHQGTKRHSYVNLLPGDTKLSSKWESTSKRVQSKLEFQKPWRQIFRYCLFANVRYGYLLTQKELVVVRISTKTGETNLGAEAQPVRRSGRGLKSALQAAHKMQKQQMQMTVDQDDEDEPIFRGFLEYKSIPWTIPKGGQDDELSINLALWCLHMMASKSRSIEKEYADLREEYQASYQASSQASTANPDNGGPQGRGKKRARKEFDSNRSSSSKGEMEPPRKLQRSFSGPMQVD